MFYNFFCPRILNISYSPGRAKTFRHVSVCFWFTVFEVINCVTKYSQFFFVCYRWKCLLIVNQVGLYLSIPISTPLPFSLYVPSPTLSLSPPPLLFFLTLPSLFVVLLFHLRLTYMFELHWHCFNCGKISSNMSVEGPRLPRKVSRVYLILFSYPKEHDAARCFRSKDSWPQNCRLILRVQTWGVIRNSEEDGAGDRHHEFVSHSLVRGILTPRCVWRGSPLAGTETAGGGKRSCLQADLALHCHQHNDFCV